MFLKTCTCLLLFERSKKWPILRVITHLSFSVVFLLGVGGDIFTGLFWNRRSCIWTGQMISLNAHGKWEIRFLLVAGSPDYLFDESACLLSVSSVRYYFSVTNCFKKSHCQASPHKLLWASLESGGTWWGFTGCSNVLPGPQIPCNTSKQTPRTWSLGGLVQEISAHTKKD